MNRIGRRTAYAMLLDQELMNHGLLGDRSHSATRKTPGLMAIYTNPVETDVPPLHSQALMLVSEGFSKCLLFSRVLISRNALKLIPPCPRIS